MGVTMNYNALTDEELIRAADSNSYDPCAVSQILADRLSNALGKIEELEDDVANLTLEQ